ncbi:hypothetical protein MMC09_006416 [Bachmanniomyces sp. S44760]|nr:hypothetical protein [Bachmanniomyces sp. S44760]
MPNYGHCGGEEFAAFAGMGILSSYLLLFISFYFATYRKEVKSGAKGAETRKGKRRNTATRAAIDMSRMEVPSVGDVIDSGKEKAEDLKEQLNGAVKENGNGSANGHASGRDTGANGHDTRSRKA